MHMFHDALVSFAERRVIYMKKQGSCSEQYGSGCPVFIVKIKESPCEKISGAVMSGSAKIRLKEQKCFFSEISVSGAYTIRLLFRK